ncbi:MAG: hypothetical protein K2N43_02285 [Lachnospiraceae bacterium]|nr:hypothetical protein [Lachnospiraceae bacterium]
MLLAIVAFYGNIHLYKKRKRIEDTGLGSYMEACCLWMLFLFTWTETLSVWHILRFRVLAVAWGGLDVLLLFVFAMQWRRMDFRIKELCEICRSRLDLRRAPYYGILLVTGVFVLGLSLITTPYNWDSMTYHLPRIAYWAQNRSVEHYATNSIRQIASPVLAEFVNLHIYILCRGHDLLFNLLQGVSYLTCAVLVGAIAGKLSCNRFFRFWAMLLYMSMPIAYAEALTTQVDNFAAVWLLFFVYRLMDYTDQTKSLRFDKTTIRGVCTLGLCVAWGYLAKPSVCVGMVVFALWLLIVCIKRKDRVWDLARLFFCALPCVVLPMAPEILRNFKSFGAYASPSAGAAQLVGTRKPSYLLVNLLKNLSFNMPTPLIKDGDKIFAKIAVKAAALLQVELNAVSISENGREYGLHEAGNYGCDTAVNPIVFWLFLFCLVWTILRIGRTKWEKNGRGYFWAATVSFLAFCTVLRWEPFVSRYMISYLALLCPMIASQIQCRTQGERRRLLRWGITGVVSLLCIVEILGLSRHHFEIWKDHARTRPYSYFTARWDELAVYAPLTDEIKSQGYESVGLYLLKADDFEYPLWEMLDGCHLEHIQVKNESAVYADAAFVPDCIIWFGALPEEAVEINGNFYGQVTEFGRKQYLLEK